jgi:Fic family protein
MRMAPAAHSLQRSAIDPPRLQDLTSPVIAALRRASNILPTLPPLEPPAVRNATRTAFARLEHRLSDAFESYNPPRPLEPRSEREARILDAAEGCHSLISAAETQTFATVLLELNSEILGRPARWRTNKVGLSPDARGNRIALSPPSARPIQLATLVGVLKPDALPDPVARAATALVLLVNCHPFDDGNGRLGRILFNAVLRQAGMPAGTYVPFYELAARARGGYVLALRTAEISGDWGPILSWAAAAIDCHQALASGR